MQRHLKRSKNINNNKNIKIKKRGCLYVHCFFKNTILTLTDDKGLVLYQISSRSSKLKDFKRNTPYIIQTIAKRMGKYAKLKGIGYMNIFIKGVGIGRYNFLKGIYRNRIKIIYIKDLTPIPFNGCRPKKKKRR